MTADSTTTLSGDLTVDGIFTATNGLNLTGTVSGTGTFSGPVTLSGTLAPGNSPGTLSFDDLTLTNTSILEIEIAGYTQGTEHDYLDVSGEAVLDGMLNISLMDSFDPNYGDQFTIAGWSSYSGEFDAINGLTGSGLFFQATYLDTGLVLTAVPEPATYALICASFMFAAVVLSRRKSRLKN